MNNFISTAAELPKKGKDIIAKDDDGSEHYCFLCACQNPKCTEWRCSLTGYGLIINVVEWKYADDNNDDSDYIFNPFETLEF